MLLTCNFSLRLRQFKITLSISKRNIRLHFCSTFMATLQRRTSSPTENKLNLGLLNIYLAESSQRYCPISSGLSSTITAYSVLPKRRNAQQEYISRRRTESTQSLSSNPMVFYKQETSESQTGETSERHLLTLSSITFRLKEKTSLT